GPWGHGVRDEDRAGHRNGDRGGRRGRPVQLARRRRGVRPQLKAPGSVREGRERLRPGGPVQLQGQHRLGRGFPGGAWMAELAELRGRARVSGPAWPPRTPRARAAPEPLALLRSYLRDKEQIAWVWPVIDSPHQA